MNGTDRAAALRWANPALQASARSRIQHSMLPVYGATMVSVPYGLGMRNQEV
jgi:hypothetical protein